MAQTKTAITRKHRTRTESRGAQRHGSRTAGQSASGRGGPSGQTEAAGPWPHGRFSEPSTGTETRRRGRCGLRPGLGKGGPSPGSEDGPRQDGRKEGGPGTAHLAGPAQGPGLPLTAATCGAGAAPCHAEPAGGRPLGPGQQPSTPSSGRCEAGFPARRSSPLQLCGPRGRGPSSPQPCCSHTTRKLP